MYRLALGERQASRSEVREPVSRIEAEVSRGSPPLTVSKPFASLSCGSAPTIFPCLRHSSRNKIASAMGLSAFTPPYDSIHWFSERPSSEGFSDNHVTILRSNFMTQAIIKHSVTTTVMFAGIPTGETRTALQNAGFQYDGRSGQWYRSNKKADVIAEENVVKAIAS
jgi:hypothetical protein